MPKFYICSDIHGFYDEFRKALDESGFDANDENSWLVSLGDEMDRGPLPSKVIDYLMSLPRAIFVRGNHTDLMEELLERRWPCNHDYSNGTFQSVLDLAPSTKTFEGACIIAEQKVRPFFDKEINYLELQNHILVHSFIPLKCNDNYPAYYTKNRKFEYDPDWRTAHASAFETARWGNPLNLAMKGLNKTGKVLVVGHWHCSTGWAMEAGIPEFGYGSCFEPYYYKDELIMIDACTAYTHKVNILVLEDKFLEEE